MKKLTQILIFAILFVPFSACVAPEETSSNEETFQSESTEENEKNEAEVEILSESSFKLNLIVANNIASPVKLLTDMNNAGLDNYRDDIINPIDNMSDYINADEKALAFGVYGADLSYIGMHGKNEEMVNYLIAIKILSDELGLASLFDQRSIDEFEKVKTNPDSMKFFIFDKYDEADEFLRSNERLLTATLILTGGLIESLHLVSSQIESGDATRDAYMIFLEQKTTLGSLLELYESLEADGQEVAIKPSIEALFKKFDEVDSFEIFSKENIEPLHEAIDQVRNKMI